MVIDDNPTTLLNLENMTALVVAIGVVLSTAGRVGRARRSWFRQNNGRKGRAENRMQRDAK